MKDNTAQVVAQVPVDVATFLLNEKRADVQTIETRFKVNVLLVPNRHLETPNYSVTRLRHDELNHSEPLPASFQMVEQPEEADPAEALREEAKEPRQEAVVKGITPAQPAPIAAPRAAAAIEPAAQAAGGWFARVMHWLRTPPAPASIPAPVVAPGVSSPGEKARDARPPRGRDTPRDGRRPESRRDGQRRDERRPDRERKDARAADDNRRTGQSAIESQRPSGRKDGEQREGRREREPREARRDGEAREGHRDAAVREPRRDSERREGRHDGERREPREGRSGTPRPAREPKQPSAEIESPAMDSSTEVSHAPAAAGNGAEDHREGGSRRRRGRRGRGGERGERAPRPASASQADPPADESVQVQPEAVLVTAAESAPATSIAPSTPSAVVESREASLAKHADETPREWEGSPPSPIPEPPAELAVARAEPAVISAQPAALTEAPRSTPEPVSMSLPPDSELVMVETRFAPVVETEQPAALQARRVRPARAVVADEPLQMVETRKEQPAP